MLFPSIDRASCTEMTHRSYKLQCRKGRLRDCSDGEMICQTTVLNYAGFFALHFPVVRFPFFHPHVIETNVQNLNVASWVLLAPAAWWYPPLGAWAEARSDAHSRPRAGRRTGHPSPALLPRRVPRPTRQQVGPHLGGSRPPSPPRAAAAASALAAPAIARPEPRKDASAPGSACALRRAPGGRQERAGGGHAAPLGTRLPWIGPPLCV